MEDGSGGRPKETNSKETHIHDLPDPILALVFSLVGDVRNRNSMALTCRKWCAIERSTRTSLSLRGNIRDLFLLPFCFPSVSHLDLSLLSPWGHPLSEADEQLLPRRLSLAFPSVTSLTLYARTPTLLPQHFPFLRHVSLVRWHPRHHLPPGSDLSPLLSSCPSLCSLDLSRFYCWPEDLPAALASHPAASQSLTSLDLLCPSVSDGFRDSELRAIATACPNLRRLLVPCLFNPRFFDFVGDEGLLFLASNCPLLSLLHLVDPATLSPYRLVPSTSSHSLITSSGLESLFATLTQLQDFALDLCNDVPDVGPALEALSRRIPQIRSLKLGHVQRICKAAWLHLDGVASCGGLQSLCIKNSVDLTDSSLAAIARGCRRLAQFEIYGCPMVTETGVKKFASLLRSTLRQVTISACHNLNASATLRSLEPVRDRLEQLQLDCIWEQPDALPPPATDKEEEEEEEEEEKFEKKEAFEEDGSSNKKCRYSSVTDNGDSSFFWCKTWGRLRHLLLWIPAGELLSPLPESGLESCPALEEITIKVEGDCRTCPRPAQPVFGLNTLVLYPHLSKMKLDCGEAIGYALTAPTGHMDLSHWERFFLHGIGDLNLYELDYWPPQDKEVNQRSLSLPATGLIRLCQNLRKLFIHGTAHEHFMRFFVEMPKLRDVQLRADYYPAPDIDMSTEMRVDSYHRFEVALNSRVIPD